MAGASAINKYQRLQPAGFAKRGAPASLGCSAEVAALPSAVSRSHCGALGATIEVRQRKASPPVRLFGCSIMRCLVIVCVTLLTVASGRAFAEPPILSRPSPGDRQVVRIQASSVEERAQIAREAKEKIEWNRRCRPSSEKGYAVAVDGCKKHIGREHAGDRQRCFAGARQQYFKSLYECHS